MAKKIFSVGFVFPGGEAEQIEYDSDQTLLDADIIIFQPTIQPYSSGDEYRGKPVLAEYVSFRAKEVLDHWRIELQAAFDAGKVVFVFLRKPRDVFVYTGETQTSGAGRSRQVSKTVSLLSSYSSIPLSLNVQASSGRSVVLSPDAAFLTAYWKEFGQSSPYQVVLEGQLESILMKTKEGNRVVGAAVRGKRGAIILLPPVQYDEDKFTESDDDVEEEYWTKEACTFGKRLLSALVGIADAVRGTGLITPPPDWVLRSEFRLQQEEVLEKAIREKIQESQTVQQAKLKLEQDLREAGGLRRLLYESGPQLEEAVLDALRLMGFTAERFHDGKSEFDAVFTSPEGRFLGEAEGKEKQAINIDKLSQLERNIQEDFGREGVSEYAKGVLFGNSYRLTPLHERPAAFTEKCLAGAKRSGVALVFTPDLFAPAKYLREHEDPEYARRCREAIFRCHGEVVTFPQLPPGTLPARPQRRKASTRGDTIDPV